MYSIKSIATFLSFGALFLLSGCGAQGPQFSEFKKPKENHGIVYIYRPSSFAGSAGDYDIFVNNDTMNNIKVGKLLNGGYEEIILPIGKSKVRIKFPDITLINYPPSVSTSLDIKDGEIYCLKGGLKGSLLDARPNLEIVDMTKCKTEIVKTKKVQ